MLRRRDDVADGCRYAPRNRHLFELVGDEMDQRKFSGIVFVVAAILTAILALGQDVSAMKDWAEASTPGFVGALLMHLASTILAFIGGQQLPTSDRLLPPSARKSQAPSTEEK